VINFHIVRVWADHNEWRVPGTSGQATKSM
jgi:hypothetical protein